MLKSRFSSTPFFLDTCVLLICKCCSWNLIGVAFTSAVMLDKLMFKYPNPHCNVNNIFLLEFRISDQRDNIGFS